MSAEDRITAVEVEVDLVDLDQNTDREERDRRHAGAYTVEVRTPAGFTARFRVHPAERVEILAQHAERHFIRRGELASGNYRLERLAHGEAIPLVASATLRDSGVVAGTVCVLVVADPQVDG